MKYAIESATLTDIADAIRAKAGTSGAIAVDDMSDAIMSITGGGGIAEERWLFKDFYLTTENGYDLPEPTVGVSYTCFVNSEEIGTAVFEGYMEFSPSDDSFRVAFDDIEWWRFHGGDDEYTPSVTSGTVSIRINGGGEDGKNYLFEDMDMPSYDNCGTVYEPVPIAGVTYFASVDGVEIGSGVCESVGATEVQLIIGDENCRIQYNPIDGWSFALDSATQSGTVSVWSMETVSRKWTLLFFDSYAAEVSYIENGYLKASGDPWSIDETDGASIGSFFPDSPFDLSTLSTDREYFVYNDTNPGIAAAHLSYKVADPRFTIRFPTTVEFNYFEDGELAGNDAVLHVELAEGVSVDDGTVVAELYRDDDTLIGTNIFSVETGGCVEFDFEGFEGEAMIASGYRYWVVVSFSIDGEEITEKTETVYYP